MQHIAIQGITTKTKWPVSASESRHKPDINADIPAAAALAAVTVTGTAANTTNDDYNGNVINVVTIVVNDIINNTIFAIAPPLHHSIAP